MFHLIFLICIKLIIAVTNNTDDDDFDRPVLALASDTSIHLAQIIELNHDFDEIKRIYQQNKSIYKFNSLTSNIETESIYVCTQTTIYILNYDQQSKWLLTPLIPVDDTPCLSSLYYAQTSWNTLIWSYRHAVIEYQLSELVKHRLWNTTYFINYFIYNETEDGSIYLSVSAAATEKTSYIIRCKYTFSLWLSSCIIMDSGYSDICSMFISDSQLYLADRIQKQIYQLTIINGIVKRKHTLSLNSSQVADIHSLIAYKHYVIWLTLSGHVRLYSFKTNLTRTLFWINEDLYTLQLIPFGSWNQTSTTTIHSSSTTMLTHTSIKTTMTSSRNILLNTNPWKTTSYITTILMSVALFLCASMITYMMITYKYSQRIPSFTNILHVLRRRRENERNNLFTVSMNESTT
ncbi:unnamed protein product [Didymodactylos carnosus]|uniref:Uncharacterized protein n=1 Tax=Didymodactylos carnosus TaxID=1234261 RepID=A0A813QGU3_9BILA|nr:unnamed protein product [Didymodactylos carnosus]CAF0909306.1 unnamed protein product [Didymodactylos carnosus]CAF3549499.1 unnamed protein product [Didymodactylos carnosus]CAF3688571.1 unnamed protein product [Didymodactylos carnosus]